MDRQEVERIMNYCQKATQGPWMKSSENPNLISTLSKNNMGHREPVFEVKSADQLQAWQNMKLIINARHDLPSLAEYCISLLDQIDELKNQINYQECHLTVLLNKAITDIQNADTKPARSSRHDPSIPACRSQVRNNNPEQINILASAVQFLDEQDTEKLKISGDILIEQI